MVTFGLIVGVIVLVVLKFNHEVRVSYGYATRKAAPLRTALLPVPKEYGEILLKYFPYYQRLPASLKPSFEKRVAKFIYSKRFIPRQMPEVSLEAKVLIAASAIQLTFGLPRTFLRHFDKILVYPNEYYSSITKRFHKGEVNPAFGIIVISWQSFVEGYITPGDSKNLGLHEMAHALRLEQHIRSEEFQPFDEGLLERFDVYARRVCTAPDFAAQKVFRPYACTNEHEFFSVAVENFFERPEVFRQELPDLYSIMTRLLRQDPINGTVGPSL